MKKPILLLTIALVLALAMLLSPLTIDVDRNHLGDLYGKVYIGNTVAAYDIDYECDGLNDHIQFQTALDALPDEGGMLYVLAGSYQFGNNQTVTSNLTGVSIVGLGSCTIFTGDGTTPLFQAGNDRWLFMNLRTDPGGLDMAETQDWCWINVAVGTTLHSVLTDQGGPSGMEQHANEWHTIDFATLASVTDLETQVDGLETDHLALNATVTDIVSDLASLNSTLVDLGISVDSLSTDLGTAQTDIQALEATSHTQGTDVNLGQLTTKTAPIDADLGIYRDSEDSSRVVTSTWTQIKAFLKTYFDTLYASGDMLKSVYDTDNDGDIDTTAGGTEWDSSSATGIVEVLSGTWGTRTDLVDTTTDTITLYVDGASGSDSNPGTSASPMQTITAALDALPGTIAHNCYVKVRGPQSYPESNYALEFSRFNTLARIAISVVNSNDQDMYCKGLATGGSTTYIDDTTASWATDQFNGAYVWIYVGTGAGQIALVDDTTATRITISGTWTAPDTTSRFAVGGAATLTATASNHVYIAGNQVSVYGFKHTGATAIDVSCTKFADIGTYYSYHSSTVKAVRIMGSSEGTVMYNYIIASSLGIQTQASISTPRANVIDCNDAATSYGIYTNYNGLSQLSGSGAYKNYLIDCVIGVETLTGSGAVGASSQTFVSCATEHHYDSTSWET